MTPRHEEIKKRLEAARARVISINADFREFDGDRRGILYALDEAEEEVAHLEAELRNSTEPHDDHR